MQPFPWFVRGKMKNVEAQIRPSFRMGDKIKMDKTTIQETKFHSELGSLPASCVNSNVTYKSNMESTFVYYPHKFDIAIYTTTLIELPT